MGLRGLKVNIKVLILIVFFNCDIEFVFYYRMNETREKN